jgi:Ca2+-transporting ATPase
MESKKWFVQTTESCVEQLSSDLVHGLSSAEAQQRQEQSGHNEWQSGKRDSRIVLFLQQFNDFMVYVLLAATVLSAILGEMLDAVAIVAIILINGVLGFVQENRAERSLQALRALSAPMAKVLRAGKVEVIAARDLVPGDIVLLESGDRIPADVRWLTTMNIIVEESALTGESMPVEKWTAAIQDGEASLGDRRNMGYLGTLVQQGTGKAIVVAIGAETEMGKIAGLIKDVEALRTPLQNRLEQLGKVLIVVSIILTAIVVLAGIWRGQPIMEMIWAGVSLAVAAIPEGLPAVVTIALALGVQRMIKRNAIIRKLPSVETLGCVEVICSDKTGTLTQNKMTVTHLWVDGAFHTPHAKLGNQSIAHDTLLKAITLCNNAQLNAGDCVGDPTEIALLAVAEQCGLNLTEVNKTHPRVHEHPFDAVRKRMTVVVKQNDVHHAFVKGAADELIAQCTHIRIKGECKRLTPAHQQEISQAMEAMAKKAMRVIGVAHRENIDRAEWHDVERAERKLVFLGLAGMIDPPREEVKVALRKCKQAGIRTVMITGDHAITAEAIAQQLDLLPPGGLVLEGKQLERMSDRELENKVDHVYVYARVTPEHKLRIVRALQQKGHVVAMTGDGVNDAPAIKTADIGIAMGITGTDVTKEAASLVLRDDNFATIVSAIEEGRNIYENVRKVIRYLLASNVGEILTMFIAMMVGLPLPLVPIQILWINLITDGLPAMALGVDQAESHLMQKKPRGAREHIFADRLGWKIISRGVLIGLCTIAAFVAIYVPGATLIHAQTVAFATLVMAQLIHVFDCRSSRSIFHRNALQNRPLVASVVLSLVLLLLVIYIPVLQPIFQTVPLYIYDWIIVTIFASIPTFLLGIFSVFRSKRNVMKIYSK